jgi:hypothetical protein
MAQYEINRHWWAKLFDSAACAENRGKKHVWLGLGGF